MPGQKLYRVGGIPASPKLQSLRESVTPEQGRYYDQSVINRILIPLRKLFSTTRPAVPMTGAGVDQTLNAILRGNRKSPEPLRSVFPVSPSEANSPQAVRKPKVRRP